MVRIPDPSEKERQFMKKTVLQENIREVFTPRLILAAPGSGSGKTLITCAMLRALTLQGKKVNAFKCGPDYIDPMFHRKVLGVPSRNLDLYFTGEEETKALFAQDNYSDISLIEGVMGLYDGLGGISEEASAYHLAKVLRAPVILIVNARGMGRSLLAQIGGFLSMDQEHLIRGVILNQVSGPFYESIAPLIEAELKVHVWGYFPVKKDLQLDSRYLGLKLPSEIENLQEKVTQAAQILKETVDLDGILDMAKNMAEQEPLKIQTYSWLSGSGDKKMGCSLETQVRQEEQEHTDNLQGKENHDGSVRIGVALDEAFCFYYEDNLRLLQNAGAELVYFSPLHDEKLPEQLDGCLLGGGYPELVAEKLSENESMRESLKNAFLNGMPSLAECGGFMYLHEKMCVGEQEYPMVGIIPGKSFDTGKLVRFGYAEFEENQGRFRIKGHEFHYYDSDACGEDCRAVKPLTGRSWKCMHVGENHVWGYGHLYYPSQPVFAKWFVNACRTWKTCQRDEKGEQE